MPKYGMIKFSDKKADMEKSYDFLKKGIDAKEYEESHLPKKSEEKKKGNEYITPQPKVGGLGMDRVKNMVRTKLNVQK